MHQQLPRYPKKYKVVRLEHRYYEACLSLGLLGLYTQHRHELRVGDYIVLSECRYIYNPSPGQFAQTYETGTFSKPLRIIEARHLRDVLRPGGWCIMEYRFEVDQEATPIQPNVQTYRRVHTTTLRDQLAPAYE